MDKGATTGGTNLAAQRPTLSFLQRGTEIRMRFFLFRAEKSIHIG